MNLISAEVGKRYIIKSINTADEELDSFLFSIGCFGGEPITVIARPGRSVTVAIKGGRYNIDNRLAEAIMI